MNTASSQRKPDIGHSLILQSLDLAAHFGVSRNVTCPVNLGRDRLDLVPQRQIVFVDELELDFALFDEIDDGLRHIGRALAAFGPMVGEQHRNIMRRHFFLQQLDFGIGIESKAVDRDDARQAVVIAHVIHVALEIRDPFFERREIFLVHFLHVDAAVILQRADRGDDRPPRRDCRPDLRHLMSTNFSAPRSAPKPASVTT